MAVSMAPMGVVPLRISKMAGAPPQTIGAPGLAKLVDGDPAQAFGRMLDDRTEQGDRCGRTSQRHRDRFAPGHRPGPVRSGSARRNHSRSTAAKDKHRKPPGVSLPAPAGHLQKSPAYRSSHARVLTEKEPVTIGLLEIQQHQVQPVQIADLLWGPRCRPPPSTGHRTAAASRPP